MQITLNQEEILEALETYVRGQIAIADNQKIDIDLKAGRGDNGYSATLDIRNAAPAPKSNATRSVSAPDEEKEPGATALGAPAVEEEAAAAIPNAPADDSEEAPAAETETPAAETQEEQRADELTDKPVSIFSFAKKS